MEAPVGIRRRWEVPAISSAVTFLVLLAMSGSGIQKNFEGGMMMNVEERKKLRIDPKSSIAPPIITRSKLLKTTASTDSSSENFGEASADDDSWGKMGVELSTEPCGTNCGYDNYNPPAIVYSSNGLLQTSLVVETCRFESVISMNTRCYNGSVPGPTLMVSPGDHIEITLINRLEFPTSGTNIWTSLESDIIESTSICQQSAEPNSTNLHFHGLHIATTSYADTPYRFASPTESIVYSFDIPESHPSGTFFYHPHKTESIVTQITGLLSGGLIIQQPQTSTSTFSGSTGITIQNVLASDNILLLQQVAMPKQAYSVNMQFVNMCAKSNLPLNSVIDISWSPESFGAPDNMAEILLVNGQYVPTLNLQANSWHRLRFINGAFHKAFFLLLKDMSGKHITASAYIIAADGIYYDSPRPVTTGIYLFYANRIDILLYFEGEGEFILNSGEPPGTAWWTGSEAIWSEQYIAKINVLAPPPISHEIPFPATKNSIVKEESQSIREVFDQVLLLDGGAGYLDQSLLQNNAVVSNQYTVSLGKSAVGYAHRYLINGHVFDGLVHRYLALDEIVEWTIADSSATKDVTQGHVWHLHAHHFQIVQARDAYGNTYHSSTLKDDWRQGDWRDSVLVPANGSITVRFRPVDFTGVVVHHCHSYNHEGGGLKDHASVVNCTNSSIDLMYDTCDSGSLSWLGLTCDPCSLVGKDFDYP